MTNDDSGVTIRPLRGPREFGAAVELQRQIWGENFTEVVPTTILMVAQKVGGVSAGAFTADDELIGFVFGLTGVRDGELVHWSDLLAVRADWRGRGIGRRLKHFQRRYVRERGGEAMYWTYDPLEARNAHLNFNRLGVRVDQYVEDMYGTTGSPLHEGVGTDRFVVVWPLTDPNEETGGSPDGTEFEEAPVINVDGSAGGRVQPVEPEGVSSPVVRIEVPERLQTVKERSMEEARQWRRSTRRAFQTCLGEAYTITSFYRDPESRRCFYVLKK